MFEEIAGCNKWLKIEKINRGWSEDVKYYIETASKEKLLLRTSDSNQYEVKKKEYEIIS
jgi:aminoglycoside phosphotransferase (APT) family kinase protein